MVVRCQLWVKVPFLHFFVTLGISLYLSGSMTLHCVCVCVSYENLEYYIRTQWPLKVVSFLFSFRGEIMEVWTVPAPGQIFAYFVGKLSNRFKPIASVKWV